jgi:preprotein translocase subunit YajC
MSTAPMFIAIGLIFYFMLIRPQMKEQKAHQSMISGLVKGDRVVLASGMHGRIHEVKDGTAIVEVADKVRVTVDKSAVKRKLAGES